MGNQSANFDDNDFYAPAPAGGNGNGSGLAAPPVNTNANSMTSVDQSRAVAEVQAALVIAKSQPRSEIQAEHKILESCKRMGLAMTAIYSYKRGSEQVEGPSIRLAETMARYWGNMNYGFREVSRDGGSSEIEAYAWDLETNTKAVRQFQMKHVRERRQGDKILTSERDVYELMANFAQRRVRACILEIIPGDIVEAAMEECNRTLKGSSEIPLINRIKKMAAVFEEFGVSAAMIEAKVQHNIGSINIHEFRQLGKLFNAIKDGYSTVEELFGAPSVADTPADVQKKEGKKAAEAKPETPPAQEAPQAGQSAPTMPNTRGTGQPTSEDIFPATLNAVEKELTRLGTPNHLSEAMVDKYLTGDPSELTEVQGQEALKCLKSMK